MRPMTTYIAHWRTRAEDRIQTDTSLSTRAFTEARQLARILGEDYGAQKVYLFGSLARENAPFKATSDIDLGVEGLSADRFYEALGELLLKSTFLVDLKPLENASDQLRRFIQKEGILLYE